MLTDKNRQTANPPLGTLGATSPNVTHDRHETSERFHLQFPMNDSTNRPRVLLRALGLIAFVAISFLTVVLRQ